MYQYHCRPGYGSKALLIEVFTNVQNESFLRDLLFAINGIHPKITGVEEIWMNDEILWTIESALGPFSLSIDIYNLAFILSQNNQLTILEIDRLLQANRLFEKIQVDFNQFRS